MLRALFPQSPYRSQMSAEQRNAHLQTRGVGKWALAPPLYERRFILVYRCWGVGLNYGSSTVPFGVAGCSVSAVPTYQSVPLT